MTGTDPHGFHVTSTADGAVPPIRLDRPATPAPHVHRADECELCGAADGTLLTLIGLTGGLIDAHPEFGAAAGVRCEPGCPSLAADLNGVDL